MTSTPDLSGFTPHTRAELLAARAAAVTELRRRVFSVPRALRAAPWVLALVVVGAVAGTSSDDEPLPLLVCAALVVAAGWRLAVHARRGRELRRKLHAWEDADRRTSWLGLPAGEVEAEHLTAYDARDRDDVAEVVARVEASEQAAVLDLRLVLVSLLSGIPLLVGLVLAVDLLFLSEPPPLWRVLGAVASGLAAWSALAVVGRDWSEAYRRQQRFNRAGLESGLYLARQAAHAGHPASAEPRASAPAAARWAVVVVLVAVVALLGGRLVTAAPEALLVVGSGLVLAGLVAVGLVRHRNRGVRVLPLRAPGPTVLEAPARHVRVRRDAGRLVLEPVGGRGEPVEVDLEGVLAVVPARVRSPFSAAGVALLTDGMPIVLHGRGVADEPALGELSPTRS